MFFLKPCILNLVTRNAISPNLFQTFRISTDEQNNKSDFILQSI